MQNVHTVDWIPTNTAHSGTLGELSVVLLRASDSILAHLETPSFCQYHYKAQTTLQLEVSRSTKRRPIIFITLT
jgi:hypothetical protein